MSDAFANVRKPAEADEFQRVEALLFEITARFVNLPSERVEQEIQHAQKHVCEHLGLDRTTLWQQAGNSTILQLTHIYQPAAAPMPPVPADAEELFPWVWRQVQLGKSVCFSDVNELPPEAARDAQSFRRFLAKSVVVVPVSIGPVVLGAVSFATIERHRTWHSGFVDRLQLLAQVFANAISRARADHALREQENRLRDAAREWRTTFDAISDPILLVDAEGRVVRANAAAAQSLGGRPEQVVGQPLHAMVPGAALPPELCPLARALASGMPQEAELADTEKDTHCLFTVYPLPADASGDAAAICVAKDISARKRAENELRRTLTEVNRLREQLHEQNVCLQQEVQTLSQHPRLIGSSAPLQRVLTQVEQVAPTHATVLLLGETGTGKELIASEIHHLSSRRDRPMVRVNCSAIPAALIESELFGRERGAYTGAVSKQLGRFELANGSTLLLDEIGELPPETQVKLLRVLQERQIERLGGSRPIAVDVRIIAATNRNLEKLVADGKFRQDLFYRLNVFPINLPPLRERPDDIPMLVTALVSEFAAALGKNVESVARESIEALQRYHWPGNVRELRNVVERAMILASGPKLRIELPCTESTPAVDQSIAAMEREHIQRVLKLTGWRIRGKTGAAEILQLKPTTLESRMAKLGIPTRRKAPSTK